MIGLPSEYHKTLDMLASIDTPVKLVIAGNHDRTLDKTWMKSHERMLQGRKWDEVYEEAREMWFGEEGRARKEGVRMLEEGVHEVELSNGAVLKVCRFSLSPMPSFTSVLRQENVSLQRLTSSCAKGCHDIVIDPSLIPMCIGIVSYQGAQLYSEHEPGRGDSLQ